MTTQTFPLTDDQLKAKRAFQAFLADPDETVFVLRGYSGCGKSTLVMNLLEEVDSFMSALSLIDSKAIRYEVALTATTNKAAENLARITGREVKTIHSFLQLLVRTDWNTGTTELRPRNDNVFEEFLVFVDEASFMEGVLLQMMFKRTKRCKFVLIGDPAQLIQHGTKGAPVFEAGFPGAELREVVRHEGPIQELSTKFRGTVETGEFFQFKPDGDHVVHLDRNAFSAKILEEFGRKDWKFSDSKILAWTNKCVDGYNKFVRENISGAPNLDEGDYAVCNSYLQIGKQSVKTDQLVYITSIDRDVTQHDVLGDVFELDYRVSVFMPKSLVLRQARLKQAKAEGDMRLVATIEETWADLRAAFACTINKAQGSTYDSVFIDLDDVGRCNSGDQLARMLYVGVSRARNHVYLTGDLA
jgi:hypothetical protein